MNIDRSRRRRDAPFDNLCPGAAALSPPGRHLGARLVAAGVWIGVGALIDAVAGDHPIPYGGSPGDRSRGIVAGLCRLAAVPAGGAAPSRPASAAPAPGSAALRLVVAALGDRRRRRPASCRCRSSRRRRALIEVFVGRLARGSSTASACFGAGCSSRAICLRRLRRLRIGVTMGWSRAAGYWIHPLLRLIGPLPATAWLPLIFFIFPTSASAQASS